MNQFRSSHRSWTPGPSCWQVGLRQDAETKLEIAHRQSVVVQVK